MTIRLIAFTDHARWPRSAEALCRLCAEAVPLSVAVVLRDKNCSYRERLSWGLQLKQAALSTGQEFFVSDRIDLARSLSADGVHLGADSVLPTQAKRLHPGPILRSGHGFSQLSATQKDRVDRLLVSPVCAPRKGREALGLVAFAAQVRGLKAEHPHLWIYALGGVDASNAGACLEAGAEGVATMGAAMDEKSRDALLGALGIRRTLVG